MFASFTGVSYDSISFCSWFCSDNAVVIVMAVCRNGITIGKLGDGEPYIEGSFQKKSWDTVNDLIKTSKEKDTISIIMNGARTLPASVLSGIKGKDISLNLDMEMVSFSLDVLIRSLTVYQLFFWKLPSM